MARILSAVLLSLFVAMSAQAQDSDFPQGPAKLKDAEASGLQRLSAAQLKTLFPGKSVVAGAATGKSMRTFNADGTLERQMLKTVLKGTWRIDEKNDAYCMGGCIGGIVGLIAGVIIVVAISLRVKRRNVDAETPKQEDGGNANEPPRDATQ